jgi:hypothetical protein
MLMSNQGKIHGIMTLAHPLHIVKDVVVVFREAFHPSIRPVIHPWHGGDNHVAIDLIV